VRLSDGSEVVGRAVALATGLSYRRLGVPSLEALTGAGVFYGAAASEAQAMKDQEVYVVGGANSAGQATVHLARYASHVTMLVRGPSLAATVSDYLVQELQAAPNIAVRLGVKVVDGHGDGRLTSLTLRDRRSRCDRDCPGRGLVRADRRGATHRLAAAGHSTGPVGVHRHRCRPAPGRHATATVAAGPPADAV
jgi:thioredoxin reductase (NADPH)